MNSRPTDLNALSRFFRYFGDVEAPRMDSPVYTALALGVADDRELLALAAESMPGQPAPNVLFAAVQNLLMLAAEAGSPSHPLAAWYPAITGNAIPDASPWPEFRRFCLENATRLRALVREGRTQSEQAPSQPSMVESEDTEAKLVKQEPRNPGSPSDGLSHVDESLGSVDANQVSFPDSSNSQTTGGMNTCRTDSAIADSQADQKSKLSSSQVVSDEFLATSTTRPEATIARRTVSEETWIALFAGVVAVGVVLLLVGVDRVL